MNFKQLPNGMCDGYVILKKCDVKKTKNGSQYLDALISDKDGEMSAKLWDFNGSADTLLKSEAPSKHTTAKTNSGFHKSDLHQTRTIIRSATLFRQAKSAANSFSI